ncbi:metallochaperone AztD [Paracoccus nototheniae]|uniref:Metallochaperone AztD n=1 Tax=Paracoccus nototheniae TaxID=2489002 RepID=A0ABW4DX25_9RHOB|nr:metallochaperone AztD [Paracoccus nototheniae]
MIRTFTGASTLALMLASTAMAQDSHDHEHEGDVTLYRLFVGDHANGQVTAIDLADPDNRWSFQTTGQTKLFPIANGTVVAAVQSNDDAVHFFDSGISFEDHGDHADIAVTEPTAIDTVLTGPRPFHLIDHDGQIVINYDRGGYAEVIESAALARGEIDPQRFPQARAHHGFVTPMGDAWLSTVASDEQVTGDASVPRLGLQAFDAEGTATGDLATCTGIHGEAFSGAYLVAGCKEGVLTVTTGSDGPVYDMLEYPAELPQDVTTGTILGSNAIQMFLGNHGPDGLVVIDPVDEPHFSRIALPFRRVDFVLDPVQPAHAYVLTEDGSLHRIDMLAGEVAASAKVTAPYSMDDDWNDPRPRIAMAGNEIVVTDPNAGLIRRISTEDLSELGTIEVDGTPYNIAVAGGSGVVH